MQGAALDAAWCPPTLRRSASERLAATTVLSHGRGPAAWAASQTAVRQIWSPEAVEDALREDRPNHRGTIAALHNRRDHLSPQTDTAFAALPQSPPAMLSRYALPAQPVDGAGFDLQVDAAGNPSTPRWAIMTLIASPDCAWALRETIADNPASPPAAFARLAADEDKDARALAAESWRCPPTLLDDLGADDWWSVRQEAARNPSTSAETVRWIASDEEEHEEVRAAAASNPNCPAETLEALATSDDEMVRFEVCRHPSCPPAALAVMATRNDSSECGGIAENPNCPPELLAEMTANPEWTLRVRAAANSRCPVEALQRLADDPEPAVRRAAANTLAGR